MFNRQSRKLQRVRSSYQKERGQQQQKLNLEVTRLDNLLNNGSIDPSTHERLKKLLEMAYEQKREDTRIKYGFA
jgi:hypothetical protein